MLKKQLGNSPKETPQIDTLWPSHSLSWCSARLSDSPPDSQSHAWLVNNKDVANYHNGVLWTALDETLIDVGVEVEGSPFPCCDKPLWGRCCTRHDWVMQRNDIPDPAKLVGVVPYTKLQRWNTMMSSTWCIHVECGGGCMGNQGALPSKAAPPTI